MLNGLEASLLPVLKKYLLRSDPGLRLEEEFSGGRGVADLVAVALDRNKLFLRRRLKTAALTGCNWSGRDHEKFRTDKETFEKVQELNIIKHCTAVELKVRDWRRGLFQAVRYKDFAHESYLAIYDRHKNPAVANLGCFQNFNIGLIGITDSGEVKVYHRPRSSRPSRLDSCLLASERIYSLVDKSQDHFVIDRQHLFPKPRRILA